MNTLRNIAGVLSFVFSPLIMPCYCIAYALFTTYLYTLALSTRLNVLLVVFAITVAIPLAAIYIMQSVGIVSDIGINRRSERTIPYIVGILCYVGVLLYLYILHAPAWLIAFILGGILTVIINAVVNTRWKISGHMAGAGAATALVLYIALKGYNVYDPQWWIYGVVLLSGLIGTSRLVLDRHTLGQVAAGYANGLISTSILLILL